MPTAMASAVEPIRDGSRSLLLARRSACFDEFCCMTLALNLAHTRNIDVVF
jgi:hypothetical protein